MDDIGWGFDVWNGRKILEEDGVEVFGSLNVNFDLFSKFKTFKRDLAIHIAFNFSLNTLDHTALVMDLETHTCFGFSHWVVDLCGLFCAFFLLAFTCLLEET